MAAERKVRTRVKPEIGTASQSPAAESIDEPGATTPANHPLADLVGKYEGEAWEAVLEAIERNRAQQAGVEADEAA
jgi:hypothetical protein